MLVGFWLVEVPTILLPACLPTHLPTYLPTTYQPTTAHDHPPNAYQVLVGIALIGAGFAVAALYPSAFVFAVWIVVLAKAHLGQRILTAMGLDLDGDGDVDWKDMVELFAKTPLGRTSRLRSRCNVGTPHTNAPTPPHRQTPTSQVFWESTICTTTLLAPVWWLLSAN